MHKLKNNSRKYMSLSLIVVFMMFGGCVPPNAIQLGDITRKEIKTLSDLAPDEIAVVGEIEIIPKLKPGEQRIDFSGMDAETKDMYQDRVWVCFSATPRIPVSCTDPINPKIGQVFTFAVKKNRNFIAGAGVTLVFAHEYAGMVRYTDGSSHGAFEENKQEISLPISFKLNIKPNAKAIYVGKIRYYRDEFNSAVKYKVIDNYKSASKQFHKKFGRGVVLQKALARRVK